VFGDECAEDSADDRPVPELGTSLCCSERW
jgi:hypothetical protein